MKWNKRLARWCPNYKKCMFHSKWTQRWPESWKCPMTFCFLPFLSIRQLLSSVYQQVPELTSTAFGIIVLFIRCVMLIQEDPLKLEWGFSELLFLGFELKCFKTQLHTWIKPMYWPFEYSFLFLVLWQEEFPSFWNFPCPHLKQMPSTITLPLWQNNRY